MKSFKVFVSEAKQVGNIHHFTTIGSLHHMVNSNDKFNLHSHNGENISFTRNPHLPMFNKNFHQCDVRITVDGDKMSEHHKIKPVAGLPTADTGVLDMNNKNRIPRSSGESEEAVMKHPVSITPYIKHIHILNHSKNDDIYHSDIKPKLDELGISHTYSKSFSRTSMVEDNLMLSWDLFYELT